MLASLMHGDLSWSQLDTVAVLIAVDVHMWSWTDRVFIGDSTTNTTRDHSGMADLHV